MIPNACFDRCGDSFYTTISVNGLLALYFQFPHPYAIYSQDEEEERKVGGHLVLFLSAHGPRAAMGRSEGQNREEG
jgi:hypothetical protein